MRSRNGNRPFLLAGIAVAFSLSFGADHYYIGYRLSTQNTHPVHETFSLSKAMQPCLGIPRTGITFTRFTDEPLSLVLEREKTPFLEYAMGHAARIESGGTFSPTSTHTRDTLTLPTRCYAVEFNDGFVTISPLQQLITH